MKGGLYFRHPACLGHDPRLHSPGHPDTPERLVTLEHALFEQEWLGWDLRSAPSAREDQLALVHAREHIDAIRDLCATGGGAIDADTFVGQDSYSAALRAAGGSCEMVRAMLAGEADVAFCGVRPSGHHAETARAMGFCLFNNIAVAAASAIAEHGLERVFVLDWDVHHGNGTAEIFHRRADVLFASIHQTQLFPGTGALEDSGSGAGEGFTLNLPVPPGSEEGLWLELMDRVVLPAARAFGPQLVLVSAGFDAHAEDPLASCRLQTGSFVALAERVRDLARTCEVPLGVVLEGGYNRRVLAECVCAVLPVLAGEDEGRTSPAQRESGRVAPEPIVERAVEQLARFWAL